MKNQSIQFEIIDHRKNKNTPNWVTSFLMQIRFYMKPYELFNEVEYPTLESINNAVNSIVEKLTDSSKKRWQGISPTVKLNNECRAIQIFNSQGNLIIEIKEIENIIYGYARVSTKKQSFEMQTEALKKFGCSHIVEEKISALADRPKYEALINILRTGDTLVVWKLDRLGRSMFDLISIVRELELRGIKFVSLTENIDTRTATGKMLLAFFSFMAEYELQIKAERQEAAKELARKNGKLGGRKKGLSVKAQKTASILKKMYNEKDRNGNYKYSISELLTALNISQGTLYNYLDYMGVQRRGNLF